MNAYVRVMFAIYARTAIPLGENGSGGVGVNIFGLATADDGRRREPEDAEELNSPNAPTRDLSRTPWTAF